MASQRSTWSRDAAGIVSSRACCSGVKGRALHWAGDPAGGVPGRAGRSWPQSEPLQGWGLGSGGATTGAEPIGASRGPPTCWGGLDGLIGATAGRAPLAGEPFGEGPIGATGLGWTGADRVLLRAGPPLVGETLLGRGQLVLPV